MRCCSSTFERVSKQILLCPWTLSPFPSRSQNKERWIKCWKPDPGRMFPFVPWEFMGCFNRKQTEEEKAAELSAGAIPRAIMGVLWALFLPFSVWRNTADGPALLAALCYPPTSGTKLLPSQQARLEKAISQPQHEDLHSAPLPPGMPEPIPGTSPITQGHPSPELDQCWLCAGSKFRSIDKQSLLSKFCLL